MTDTTRNVALANIVVQLKQLNQNIIGLNERIDLLIHTQLKPGFKEVD